VQSAVERFEREAARLAALYEQAHFHRVHAHLLPHLPPLGSDILDVGSGSGRDAAALARMGYKVTAVEPSSTLISMARALHRGSGVHWIHDGLPDLRHVRQAMFDFIMLSAVWMYVPPRDRHASAATLARMTRPGGRIALSLRELADDEPGIFRRDDVDRTAAMFAEHGFEGLARYETGDTLRRLGKKWTTLVLAAVDRPSQ